MTIYYLSGPMRSRPEYNRAQFIDVETALIADLFDKVPQDIDDRVINPSRNFDGDQALNPNVYMTLDLMQVLEADVIVLLPDWRKSEGARREVQLALWSGKEFLEARFVSTLGMHGEWHFKAAEITSADDNVSPRAQTVQIAESLITGDRNNRYGPPHQDFRRSADAMTAYGYRHTQLPANAPDCPNCGSRPMQSHDTAILIDCVKTSRIMWSPSKQDNWIDKAGYAGCGYECTIEDDKERRAFDCS